MKIIFTAFVFFLSFASSAQTPIVGRYRNHFGNRIELNTDSTFTYTWQFDLQSSWTKGRWTVANDTVFFLMIPVYDTSQYLNGNGQLIDTLILSPDEEPQRILSIDTSVLLSYGQNYQVYPDKLFFRGGKLYIIQNGSLVKKKQKGFWTKKKWRPWYFKSND